MTKEELIHLTLRQLKESLKSSPENFRLEDPEFGVMGGSFPGPTIVWQFKVQLKDGQYIPDPLNATRTIMVPHNKLANTLSCYIFFREMNTLTANITPDSQASIDLAHFPILNRTYRQFADIRKSLIKQKREKEFVEYLQKLNNIFPSTHEDELFK